MVWLQDGTVAGLRRSNRRNLRALMDASLAYRTREGLNAPRSRSGSSKCTSKGVRYGFGGHCIAWE
jgi:hypothetical protein